MAAPSPEEFVEVFHTDSTIAAQKILDVLLVPNGVHAVIHDRKDHAFNSAGLPGGVYIAVAKEHQQRAVELIDEARTNGFLDVDEGEPV